MEGKVNLGGIWTKNVKGQKNIARQFFSWRSKEAASSLTAIRSIMNILCGWVGGKGSVSYIDVSSQLVLICSTPKIIISL